MADMWTFAGVIRVARILRIVNSQLGSRAGYEGCTPATHHGISNTPVLVFGDSEGGFDQLDGISAGHDFEDAGLDDAVHVAIEEGEVVET